MWRAPVAAAALAALSLLVVAPAPSYDPWMWLLWGREVAEGALATQDGPAFKPLPVAVCALLAPLGGSAPVAWVLLVRTAALAAAWMAWRLGRRLAGGSRLAGALAAAGVLLCGRLLDLTAAGAEPALVLAAALGGIEAWRAGHVRLALACALACALLRVEAWPFVLAGGVVLWRRAPGLRPALALAAVLVPAAWLVPEWLASGDPLRSGARARVLNPGQPALADVPALAALRAAAELPLWPLWLGVAALAVAAVSRVDRVARTALLPAAAGTAWIAVVAAMAQAGFSGEPRYALPGAALIAVSGAAGLVRVLRPARLAGGAPDARSTAPLTMAPAPALAMAGGHDPPRPTIASAPASARHGGTRPPTVGRRPPRPRASRLVAALAVGLVAIPAGVRLSDLPGLRDRQAYQWQLATELGRAIAAAGGRGAVLRCGTPYVGPLRGPLLAYRLRVAKAAVEPDAAPRAPGTVFRSALVAGAEPAPTAPAGFIPLTRTPHWDVSAACPLRVP